MSLNKEKCHFTRDKLKYLGLIISKEGIETDNNICEPLYQLKKKGAKFNWSTEAQDAFNKVKRALTEAPVLKLPNFQEQFNLFTDASGVGIGAVLNQINRHIAFASRTLNKAERNYTVTEREFLAVIWAFNKFKTYFGITTGEENPDDGSVNETVCEGWSQDFKLIDGLAKYSTTLGELGVYIPKSLREAIIQEFHDLPLAGYLGKEGDIFKVA
ncbi:retrovirus-related Pol polyprotein from transposon 17.6 [Trichonephila clavipes]|nr:retrovirus-related Pol polyprotein from transposon 17.6 [Trichonephila clavipes]